ncbi:hypothetical protein HPQ64_14540 [Rhizobiales bacterium]|uniref:hypothetical protein n=1 Tax=Hongsoonwoonella zoysiae TaxID=2821844 RepID=UPI001560C12B|nr:hypothetical protein [Hongsoonwoonella zoysiae]NRG18908.1 hypothetical protein [Hongsoonwoonella zoysiae]
MQFGLRNTALAATLVCATALSWPAAAFDPTGNETADHFLKTVEAGRATIRSIGSVSQDGDGIRIGDLSVDIKENEKTAKLVVGETLLQNASILDNDRLSIGLLEMTTITIEADDGGLTVQSLKTTDTVMPSPEEVSKASANNAIAPLYRSAEVNGIEIRTEDQGAVPIEQIKITVDSLEGDLPTAGAISLRGLKVSREELDDDGKKMLDDLGYDEVNISVHGVGRWTPDDGKLNMEMISISGEDVADLSLSARINGVTRELVEQLDKAQGNPQAAMGLLQGLSIEHLSIDLQNKSVVERLLEKQAREAGTDRSAFVGQLTGALPLMLSILNNPQFQEKVATALSAFLQEPNSLRVIANPANPVPVAQIIGAAMVAPQTLPDILGVDIQANQAR